MIRNPDQVFLISLTKKVVANWLNVLVSGTSPLSLWVHGFMGSCVCGFVGSNPTYV